jgi:hypothetical protein
MFHAASLRLTASGGSEQYTPSTRLLISSPPIRNAAWITVRRSRYKRLLAGTADSNPPGGHGYLPGFYICSLNLVIYGLFNDVVNMSDNIASSDRVIKNNEFERM